MNKKNTLPPPRQAPWSMGRNRCAGTPGSRSPKVWQSGDRRPPGLRSAPREVGLRRTQLEGQVLDVGGSFTVELLQSSPVTTPPQATTFVPVKPVPVSFRIVPETTTPFSGGPLPFAGLLSSTGTQQHPGKQAPQSSFHGDPPMVVPLSEGWGQT